MLLGYLYETSSGNKTIYFLLTLEKDMTNVDKYMKWLTDTVEETTILRERWMTHTEFLRQHNKLGCPTSCPISNVSKVNWHACARQWHPLNTHITADHIFLITQLPQTLKKCPFRRMLYIFLPHILLTHDRTQFFLDTFLSQGQNTLRSGLVSPSSNSPQ